MCALDDYRWLVGADAARWLARAQSDPGSTLAVAERLRRELPRERVHLILQQVELRRRAREKFSRADVLFFTRRGLEQATDEWIAGYKATRFPAAVPLADLCCGIGGDAHALAQRGALEAVDRDEIVALLAEANLRLIAASTPGASAGQHAADDDSAGDHSAGEHAVSEHSAGEHAVSEHAAGEHAADVGGGLPDGIAHASPHKSTHASQIESARALARVQARDVEQFDLGSFAAWHIDPDRRPGGHRTTDVERHDPPAAVLDRLLDSNPHGAIKLAPAAQCPESWVERCQREWISRRGECRQQVAWFGCLAECPGTCRATVLDPTGQVLRTIVDVPTAPPPPTSRVGRYVFEPDSAVLAAGLAAHLARRHRLIPLTPRGGLLTGDEPVADEALVAFAVDDVLPLDRGRLRTYVRTRGIGRLEIKTRGVPHDPATLERTLRGRGSASATLLLYRGEQGAQAVFARRLST